MTKLVPLASVPDAVTSGCVVGLGGSLLNRKPMAMLRELVRAGTSGLHLVTFLGSVDVELLVAHGRVREATVGYVGFEHHGFAPAWTTAVAERSLAVNELSELLFAAALRAAATGLPFLPTRGALGSDLLAETGFRTIECPYTAEPLVAVPALSPDVVLLHADAADERGTVLGSPEPEFLFDADANLARAGRRVIVSVERLAERSEIERENLRTLLHSYEVDAVVVAPGGARPSSLPGRYVADVAMLHRYLGAVASGIPPSEAEL